MQVDLDTQTKAALHNPVQPMSTRSLTKDFFFSTSTCRGLSNSHVTDGQISSLVEAARYIVDIWRCVPPMGRWMVTSLCYK